MTPTRDPEGREARHLIHASQFAGKKVLEIGCGSGWLTWQYANLADEVIGIDPILPDLRTAKANQPASVINFALAQTAGEALPFPSGTFDISVFALSL